MVEDENIPKAPQLFELDRLKSFDVENKTIRVTDPEWPVNLMADGVFQNSYQNGWFHQEDDKV